MALTTITGDLVGLAQAGRFDVIAHGCNCMCTMGAGIAKLIRRRFPAAYAADLTTTKGDRAKLGTCTSATIDTGSHQLIVVNAYTQYGFSGDGDQLRYDSLATCMAWIAQNHRTRRIGLPRIGAGLAGGDWERIHGILATAFADCDATVVEFQP